ncbi:MAG: hypothetical protein ACRCZO_13365 [Cetobacterium sp.]
MILVIIFLYIFLPPLKIPLYHLLSIGSLVFLFFNIKKNNFLKKKIIINGLIVVTILIYNTIIIMGSLKKISNLNTVIVSFVEIPIIALALISYFKNLNQKIDNVLELCIKASFCQSILSILAFIFPSIQNYFVEKFIFRNLEEEAKAALNWLKSRRLYGLSNGLTYSTPIYQAVIASIILDVRKKKYQNFLFFITIIFSSIVNARIGGVVFILSYFILLISELKNKKIKKIILLFICSFISIFLLVKFKNNQTVIWIEESIVEISRLLEGERTGTFKTLLSETFLNKPKGIDLILGTGEIIFGKNNGSDIGYINDLWFGGIIYSLILWLFISINIIWLYFSKIKSKYVNLKALSIIFLIVCIISHIKGTFYGPSSYWNFLILIFMYNIIGEE